MLRRPAASGGKRAGRTGRRRLLAAGADSQPAQASPYWLGVEVFTVIPALRAQLGLAEKEGLVVEAMPPGGPAERPE